MSGFPWWVWIMLAGVLALAEMGVPSAYLMWIALGAAVTAVVDAWFGLLLEGQLAVFAVATSISCIIGYFVYGSMQPDQRTEEPLNEPHRAMLGARGTVCEAFLNGRGKVRIGDTVWLANGPELTEGALVVVSGVHGTRLVVVEVPRPRNAADPEKAASPP
jgi:membrane protein implicated in regulation of membrane protease activity